MQQLYLNPHHVVRPSPVKGFNQIAVVDPKTDNLDGWAVVSDHAALANPASLIVNTGADCSDPTHVSIPVQPPMAIAAPQPVYNHCGQLIGYIGSVVKNSAVPISVLIL